MTHFVQLNNLLLKTLAKEGKYVHMIRHGQSMGNQAGSIVGWTDSKLTLKGRAQANQLYRGFHNHIDSFTSIHSSDLVRCTNTLEFALAFSPLPIHKSQKLRQMHFGDDQGVHFDSLPQKEKDIINSFDYSPKNGETWTKVKERAFAYLTSLPSGHHLICTHGGLICSLTHSLGLKDILNNCSVVSLVFNQNQYDIEYVWEYPKDPELTPK